MHIVDDHSICEIACQVRHDERSEELEMERSKKVVRKSMMSLFNL